jgi:glucose-6-phosphate dehydrogenase assembly protein OpcA
MEDVMSDTPNPPAPESVLGTPVALADAERELSRQMKALQGAGQAPILRARMSNLVIYCNRRDAAEDITAQIPDIGAVHPARVLMLIGDGTGDSVQAWVRVRAEGTGHQAHVTAEQVTISTPTWQVDRLPFAVRALLIGDLPTNLWWASNQPPPFAGSLLYELADNAQQIIYDSIGWIEPARGVAATATWLDQVERTSGAGRWRVASDLNWRRLKWWRRLLAQALAPGSAPGARESITEVLIEHGPHAVVQAWELASVMSQWFGWKVQGGTVQTGVEIAWRFMAAHGDVRVRIKRLEHGPAEIRRIRIACSIDNQPGALNLVVESEQRLAILLEGIAGEPRTMSLPPLTPAELIGRQLSDRERDPVFHESMAVAQMMAQSLL